VFACDPTGAVACEACISFGEQTLIPEQSVADFPAGKQRLVLLNPQPV
jgi:hypothetical protein